MSAAPARLEVRLLEAGDLPAEMPRLEAFVARHAPLPLSRHPAWPLVFESGLRHKPYLICVCEGSEIRGILPLAYVRSMLFGRFLVSLPYLNYGGVLADDAGIEHLLIDQAVALADRLDVRYLELRQERDLEHPGLVPQKGSKVNMTLQLPASTEELWSQIPSKVRNQIRKGQKSDLTVAWGGSELLADFHAVFSRNMRDLGTPVYASQFFGSMLERFPDRAELGVVRLGRMPIAGGLLLHGWQVTEVPSASSLREYNSTCANMLLYWEMLERTTSRGQKVFDFGRSSPDSPTNKFKKQWGAVAAPAVWHFYLRQGAIGEMRPDHPKYQFMRKTWQRLPVWMAKLIGPSIVRGIP